MPASVCSGSSPTRREQARERYRAYVEERGDGVEADLACSIFLGSERFAVQSTRGLGPLAEIPRGHWQPVRPSLAELLAARTNARIAAAYSEYGYTMREFAELLGVHYATVSRRIRRHEVNMSECKT